LNLLEQTSIITFSTNVSGSIIVKNDQRNTK